MNAGKKCVCVKHELVRKEVIDVQEVPLYGGIVAYINHEGVAFEDGNFLPWSAFDRLIELKEKKEKEEKKEE